MGIVKQACQLLNLNVKEVRAKLAKFANIYSSAVYRLSRSEAWRYAWAELKKLITRATAAALMCGSDAPESEGMVTMGREKGWEATTAALRLEACGDITEGAL